MHATGPRGKCAATATYRRLQRCSEPIRRSDPAHGQPVRFSLDPRLSAHAAARLADGDDPTGEASSRIADRLDLEATVRQSGRGPRLSSSRRS